MFLRSAKLVFNFAVPFFFFLLSSESIKLKILANTSVFHKNCSCLSLLPSVCSAVLYVTREPIMIHYLHTPNPTLGSQSVLCMLMVLPTTQQKLHITHEKLRQIRSLRKSVHYQEMQRQRMTFKTSL